MSEPIPESIPTSADPRSRRPIKRARTGANDKPTTAQADEIENLMWDPTRPVDLPPLSSTSKSSLAPPPEIVANVQGSSAGAGSGEFHVYKASRRREYERLRAMDEEAKQEDDERQWKSEEQVRKEKDEEKTRKNREKRNRRKKGGKGGQSGTGAASKDEDGDDGEKGSANGAQGKSNGVKKNLQVPKRKDREGSSDFAVAEVIKENGITIHDDD